MSDDTKQTGMVMVFLAVAVVTLVVGGFKCEQSRQAAVVECVKTGRSPLECKEATR